MKQNAKVIKFEGNDVDELFANIATLIIEMKYSNKSGNIRSFLRSYNIKPDFVNNTLEFTLPSDYYSASVRKQCYECGHKIDIDKDRYTLNNKTVATCEVCSYKQLKNNISKEE